MQVEIKPEQADGDARGVADREQGRWNSQHQRVYRAAANRRFCAGVHDPAAVVADA